MLLANTNVKKGAKYSMDSKNSSIWTRTVAGV